jgi:hypothetical protein
MVFANGSFGVDMASQAQDTELEKRVVMYVVTGRRKGLRRIIGHMIFKPGDELPKRIDNVFICKGEQPRDVHLVGEYPRYVLYSEIEPPKMKKPRAPKRSKVVVTDGMGTAS